MKLTKSQIKQIIIEELERLNEENHSSDEILGEGRIWNSVITTLALALASTEAGAVPAKLVDNRGNTVVAADVTSVEDMQKIADKMRAKGKSGVLFAQTADEQEVAAYKKAKIEREKNTNKPGVTATVDGDLIRVKGAKSQPEALAKATALAGQAGGAAAYMSYNDGVHTFKVHQGFEKQPGVKESILTKAKIKQAILETLSEV